MAAAFNQFTEENLSDARLKFGYWLTTHRLILRRILIAVLALFDVIFLGYALFKWSDYLARGYFRDRQMIKEMVRPAADFSALRKRFGAAPLVVGDNYFFRVSPSRGDAAATLFNPNKDFFASFDYSFVWSAGQRTPWRRAFLLPQEEKPVVEWGTVGESADQPTAELRNISWQRISKHQVSDLDDFLSKHLNFSVEAFSFIPYSAALNRPRLLFDITNATVYNFAESRFLILLKSGGNLIGIEQVVFDRFASGEKKKVELRPESAAGAVSEIEVKPDINIFDPRQYF